EENSIKLVNSSNDNENLQNISQLIHPISFSFIIRLFLFILLFIYLLTILIPMKNV
ncbi:unnamed protein product, partial [Rotaria magnacalcarata]